MWSLQQKLILCQATESNTKERKRIMSILSKIKLRAILISEKIDIWQKALIKRNFVIIRVSIY